MRTHELFFLSSKGWRRARPWLAALGLSGLAHAWLLQGPILAPSSSALRSKPGVSTVRVQARGVSLNEAEAKARIPSPGPVSPAAAAAETEIRRARPAAQTLAELPSRPETAAAAEPAADSRAAPSVRLAAAGEWHYILLQNGVYGRARLSWQPSGPAYSLMLERELEGRALPTWKSQGQIAEQGLSPERYVQQQHGRDRVATNFRREEGLISFSAGSELVPLPEGVQDRLSWWIQLSALINAAPERYPPGSELRLPVASLRGAPREWLFEVVDQGPLELPAASIARALHLRRAALGPYQGAVEVWLDPARGHIPVQLSMELADDRSWQLQLSTDPEKP